MPGKVKKETGVKISGGSDCPVETCDPFYGIWAAVNRQGLDGRPPGGWNADQKLGVNEAIKIYTSDAAFFLLKNI